ncbi:MAG: PAS domain S-box protein [Bacteroidia bacterium]|nr:PAS domain S-box protein [Bacteroidia bacterium]
MFFYTKNLDCQNERLIFEQIYHIKTMVNNKPKKELLEELHRKMIQEIADVAIILLDKDGTILSWNKGAQTIKGYNDHEIIGQNFNIFYMPSDRQAGLPEQLMALAAKEGRAKHIGRRVRKDGTTFWGSILITALHNDLDEVIGYTKLTRELRDNEME